METMNKNQKPAPPQAPKKDPHPLVAELAAMDGVPCAILRFCMPQGGSRDLPLEGSNGGFTTLPANERRTIAFLSKVGMYRVVEVSRDPKVKTKTLYVPREWATFEPLE